MAVYFYSYFYTLRLNNEDIEDITNFKTNSRKKLTYNPSPKLQEILSHKCQFLLPLGLQFKTQFHISP